MWMHRKVRVIEDIVNSDVTESGIIVYSKDTTINSIRRRVPVW